MNAPLPAQALERPPVPAATLVRVFSWVTVLGTAYGLAAAHVPGLVLGTPWSLCGTADRLPCVLAFHLFEVPLVIYELFVAWYGLRRFSRATLPVYRVLVAGLVVVNAAFCTFEAVLLVSALRDGAPTWEILGLASIVATLAFGIFFALFVAARLAEPVAGDAT